MIDKHTVLGVILARGGSKGLSRKNVRDLAGKPLIAWTIEAGHESRYLDRLILSSDDREIMEVAERHGCDVPFRRPSELAKDETTSIDALLHALEQVPNYDYVVLLQPTSPLRSAEDIDSTIERCRECDAPACVTVVENDKPPEWMYTLTDDYRLEPVVEAQQPKRRQEATDTFLLNGAVYTADTEWIIEKRTFLTQNTIAEPMPLERSPDIDTPLDLAWCEFLISTLDL